MDGGIVRVRKKRKRRKEKERKKKGYEWQGFTGTRNILLFTSTTE